MVFVGTSFLVCRIWLRCWSQFWSIISKCASNNLMISQHLNSHRRVEGPNFGNLNNVLIYLTLISVLVILNS